MTRPEAKAKAEQMCKQLGDAWKPYTWHDAGIWVAGAEVKSARFRVWYEEDAGLYGASLSRDSRLAGEFEDYSGRTAVAAARRVIRQALTEMIKAMKVYDLASGAMEYRR